MKLVDQVTRSFRVAKVFRENTDRINAIDFSPTGDLLVSSSDDDQIVIYDVKKGIQKSTLYSRKYGVDLVRFTHAKNAVIHGSTKVDDTIRYLSLHDNKYIRYFPGHTKKVVAVAMSPVDDTFLSSSADKTLRLWDLRSPNCQGLMHLTGKAVAGFDPEGLVFAAGINSECVKLYDLRSFDKGPFITFKLSQEKECDWTGLKFSPDGKMIILSTNGSVVRLIDAFLGTPLQTLTGHLNNKGVALEASFSPDSQCVFSGSTDGRVHVWNAETGYKISVLNADHPGPVQCIQFNPKFMMLASACTNMAFWLPSISEDAIVDGPPSLGTLYIRRRSQLLREHVKEDSALCRQYLRIRSQLLQQRYGVAYDQTSLKSRSVSVSARSGSRISESPDMHQTLVSSPTSGVVPTNQAEASRAIVGGTSIAENYAFAGVHFIFDQHTDAVTLIKFANNDRSRMCCASLDGTLSICNVTESPPAVEFFLKGHKKGVTGFDWSVQNDLLISCSYDRTIRLWDTNKGLLLRTVEDQSGAEVLSVAFQPANNNVVVAGTSRGLVQVLNMSTGIYPKGGSSKVGGGVLSLAFEAAGTVLWAGDEKGVIVSFLFEIATGRLSKCRRIVVSEDRPITSISYRAWISREARDPSLLISCAAGFLFLYRVTDEEGGLKIRRKFPLRHRTKQLVRSTFCPLMSFRQGACVVSGSEDCCVYFFNIERESKACVNKLQGHSSTVLGVTFNYDESLLATSDSQGLVIMWKREKRTGT